MAEGFERQLDLYAQHFECIDPKKLLALQRGEWKSSRPGLILSFDDGLRSHADVVAPLLEARGWVGWFMVPFSFVEAPASAQGSYAEGHQIGHAGHDYGDPRIAISWDDVRRLSSHHVIDCHGLTHRRLGDTLAPATLMLRSPRPRPGWKLPRAAKSMSSLGSAEKRQRTAGARPTRLPELDFA